MFLLDSSYCPETINLKSFMASISSVLSPYFFSFALIVGINCWTEYCKPYAAFMTFNTSSKNMSWRLSMFFTHSSVISSPATIVRSALLKQLSVKRMLLLLLEWSV